MRAGRMVSNLAPPPMAARVSSGLFDVTVGCDLPHIYSLAAALGSARLFDQRVCAMSGERRLLREGNRAPSILASRLNFGAVAFVLLAAIAIVLTLMFPEIQLQPPELLVGP
jgi:hypothetical protein